MSSELPLPLRFELPDEQWTPVPPASRGVVNAAFLAVRAGLPGDYEPTLTISGGWRTDGAGVEQIGDESLAKLRLEGAEEVELLKRRVTESEHAPAVTQAIGAVVAIGGRTFDLRQAQVVEQVIDVDDPARRVVNIFTLTCTYGQWEQMVPEFQAFMASVEVVPGPGVDVADDQPPTDGPDDQPTG